MTAAPDVLPFPGELINQTYRAGNYLAPVLALREVEAEYLASPQWRGVFAELASMQAAFAGEVAEAHRLFDLRRPPPPPREPYAGGVAGFVGRDALEVVAEEAARHRAVFVNEAHHVPQHRAFTLQLLERLHALGYRWLAVEALSPADTAIQDRGYPNRGSGLYTDEPLMGDVVRRAIELGYTVVAYDVAEAIPPRPGDPHFAMNERERIQAENLRQRVLEVDPDARLLVHAGYGHIQEAPTGAWVPMAVRFREITGIDPFTVDQTVMTERSGEVFEHPLFRAAEGADLLRAPTVLTSATGEFVVEGMATDAQVLHPRTRLEHGRPDWMRVGGLRAAYVPDLTTDGTSPQLVQAFVAGEGDGATPLDQTIRSDGTAVLFLRPGTYRLRVIDAAGSVLDEYVAEAGSARLRALD
jgi:hypothetical protein